ncbi:LLM class flavin-dependent oxidoreductase [Cellulomonas marina]|uniref:Flavin-dependent oxidoreductase, luciferase family (Includes alkanesulfonate monooxygenase SsuD and methylene tetrahydromethanopterin reductase) n=1 Tax=Cellulomonas marina TaxID=988821 RepID=A0A1I0Z3V4_9CELL|nr:LLM class flavin-dependent oxidoreductase [Cellulomonas marina]GIG28230.1 luciferase [Cellulomonas marina]SFB20295.1 Flavin-dependent oxidoreductase, luciferase family (includes alkanesulfonate monooxygenase SsuD and methylene tetrahydromethanopterin reductase) [Cellulomonas marina]
MVAVGMVLLPQERWSRARRRWTELEERGYDHAWTYDHLAWRSLVDEPWFATVPLLAAAAAVTERIALGTFVASPNFRHPVPFAKDVMGLDDVSGGRFLLGIGSGGEGFDAGVLGPAPTRGQRTRRFEEFVAVLDRLLTQAVTDHVGEAYEAHGARMHPGTLARPRPPFLVAANGPRTMALAARLGEGWVTYGPALGPEDLDDEPAAAQERWWEALAALSDDVDRAEATAGRAAAGRPPLRRVLSLDGAPRFALSSVDLAVEGVERAAALGFTDVVLHWPRAEGVYAGDERVAEAFSERLPALQALPVAPRPAARG